MTAIEMLQFGVGSLNPAVPPYELRYEADGNSQHFHQLLLLYCLFFCCIFAHRLLGARSVRTLNVGGLFQVPFTLFIIIHKPCFYKASYFCVFLGP